MSATTLLSTDRQTKSHSKRKIDPTQTVNLITCTNAFMHLHWSAKTSSKISTGLLKAQKGFKMILRKALEISLNIKEMLRFICKRQRLLSYHYQFTGAKTHTKGFPGWKESQFIPSSVLLLD